MVEYKGKNFDPDHFLNKRKANSGKKTVSTEKEAGVLKRNVKILLKSVLAGGVLVGGGLLASEIIKLSRNDTDELIIKKEFIIKERNVAINELKKINIKKILGRLDRALLVSIPEQQKKMIKVDICTEAVTMGRIVNSSLSRIVEEIKNLKDVANKIEISPLLQITKVIDANKNPNEEKNSLTRALFKHQLLVDIDNIVKDLSKISLISDRLIEVTRKAEEKLDEVNLLNGKIDEAIKDIKKKCRK